MLSPEPIFLLLGASATSPSLASTIDAFVPIYTIIALTVIYSIYKEDEKNSIFGKVEIKTRQEVIVPPSPSKAKEYSSSEPTAKEGGVNLSGSYKLLKNIDYQPFLAVQGVGWALRKAADSAALKHHLTHDPKKGTFHIKVEGLISSQMGYQIDGDPVETIIKDKVFSDTVSNLPGNTGVRIKKINAKEKYHIIAERTLGSDGNTITMEQKVVFDDGRPGAKATQIFTRIE